MVSEVTDSEREESDAGRPDGTPADATACDDYCTPPESFGVFDRTIRELAGRDRLRPDGGRDLSAAEDRKISATTPGETPTDSGNPDSIAGDGRGAEEKPEVEPMLAVYRHDVHKMQFEPHESASDSVAGVPINGSVPLGADRDAALLSRPQGDPKPTVKNHDSPYRLALTTGLALNPEQLGIDAESALQSLVTVEDPRKMHREWLAAALPAAFNESVFYPYTSLKYHTLLAAALLSNYRVGAGFDDLFLVVDPPGDDHIVPHRTVLSCELCNLRVTATPSDRPAASLGALPARSWADVWSRLDGHPLDTNGNRHAMILDAQLRRIRSWSTALQFIEDISRAWGDRL